MPEPVNLKTHTIINYYCTDQGNGGWFCSCGAHGHEAYIDICPGCKRTAIQSEVWVSPGGSDF